jgi:transcriptional regulator with XRE-family HTH domain
MEHFFKRVQLKLVEIEHRKSWLLQKTGIKPSTWSSWETRGRIPPADRAVAIADALGVTVEFLVTGKESMFDMRGSSPLLPQVFNQLKDLDERQLRRALVAVNTIRLAEPRV